MIGLDVRQVIQPVQATPADGGHSAASSPPTTPLDGKSEVSFDDPDAAYLVAASLQRYLDPSLARGVTLIPTERGPALEISAATAELRLVRSLVGRFRGRITPVAD